jgi:hypothetical protein
MALITWEFLRKSQFDNEKIEEAVARLIAEHNDDETAHLEVGQSLQSHKASEIIDHLAASIVADKIGDREVLDQHMQHDRQVIAPAFDSLDGFYISATGTGASIIVKGGGCRIIPGSVVNNVADFAIEALVNWTFHDTEPDFQLSFSLFDEAGEHPERLDADICIGFGYENDYLQSIGFIWKGAEQKFYTYYRDGESIVEDEVVGFNPLYLNDVRVEVRDLGDTLNFYYHGELVKQYTGVGLVFYLAIYFGVIVKNLYAGAGSRFCFYDLVWSQSRYILT